jgi:hypothetical protein
VKSQAIYLERRAPSRLEGGLPYKLAEAVLGVPLMQAITQRENSAFFGAQTRV